MLNNLRKKLSNAIQEGIIISDNLQQQYRQRSQTSTTPDEGSTSSSSLNIAFNAMELGVPPGVNMTAGCNMLAKYEDDWKAIHDANEQTAQQASQLANQIENIQQHTTTQRLEMTDLITCLSGIPALLAKIEASRETLQTIGTLSATVERELEHLQDLCEECDLQEFMLQKQCELSQYKQKKMTELECYRQKVAAEHQATIRQHEQRLLRMQRERQAVFDNAFRDDVEEYKRKGSIKKIQKEENKAITLEEVVLEDTETVKDALEEFLNG